jgi:alpha-amylase
MPSLSLCFHIHQPYRLRRVSFFEARQAGECFDAQLNRSIIERISTRCYEPAFAALKRCIDSYGAAFGCAFSITGVAVEQLRDYVPKTLESFARLTQNPCVELLGETYYHSLASMLVDEGEFAYQVQLHRDLMQKEFGASTKVFRNTELIYSDSIAARVSALGFSGIVAEGIPEMLTGLPAHQVYTARDSGIRVITRDFMASDEIGFRFVAHHRGGRGLTAQEFVRYLDAHTKGDGHVCIYVDFETFGEHVAQSTGILSFLEELPGELLKTNRWTCITPSEALDQMPVAGVVSAPCERSWADSERDTSAWLGNSMQKRAFEQLYGMRDTADGELMTWRRLQTSDHLYYMSLKSSGDGEVHKHFSPYESPYDAFITYMNALRMLEVIHD